MAVMNPTSPPYVWVKLDVNWLLGVCQERQIVMCHHAIGWNFLKDDVEMESEAAYQTWTYGVTCITFRMDLEVKYKELHNQVNLLVDSKILDPRS